MIELDKIKHQPTGMDPNAVYCEWLVNKFGRDEAGGWQEPPVSFDSWVARGMPFCAPTFELSVQCKDCGVEVPCQDVTRKEVCDSCRVKRQKKNKESWRQRQIAAEVRAGCS